ncbi:MAG TPA: bacillithiol biosynthesis cysteine-adding enzyme BshC [Gemmatimonadaceae bacterium]|nr:bacillithiol biosynthesis cysteine-adding enzyme BshC [Gemmatimonadaceae bacterium]
MTLRVISTPIVGTGLTRVGVDRDATSPWFETVPRNAAEWKTRAETIRGSLIQADWLTPLAPAFNASGAAARRLERAAASGIAVTAGQQPGLFGGPLYTWWKALTALSLADRLERETGFPVVPIFWAATDDSDYAEAAGTVVSTHSGAERISLPPVDDNGRALAEVRLGDVSEQLLKLVAATGSAPNASIIELVRSAYSADHTVGSAYVELLRKILEPLGVAVIDASHPAVRKAASPILRQALLQLQPIEDALLARSADLKTHKLSAQVKLVKGRSLVFEVKEGARDRVRAKDAESTAERAGLASLGPNVLLRPIVERSIIPTVAYIGGPAEVAYFAQVTAVADAMKVTRPVIVPRWSGMVIEPRVERILERYNLSPEDFRDPHAVETRMARESLSPDLVNRIQDFRKSVDKAVADLSAAPGANIVAPAVLDGLRNNVGHRIERLERRFTAAVKRDGNEALRELAIARGALFPEGAPQERAQNFIPLLARYGDEIISAVMSEITAHTAKL